MKWIFVLVITTCSCGIFQKPKPRDEDPIKDKEKLKAKISFYLETTQGWDLKDCDSLLFYSLGHVGGYSNLNIEEFQQEPGKWLRRPIENGNCYPEESKSEISRDMILGLLYLIYHSKRMDLAQDLYTYAHENRFKMGEGASSRVYLTPQLFATISETLYQVGGPNYADRLLDPIVKAGLSGYRAHLMVLHLYLRGEMRGYKPIEQEALDWYAKDQPDNAFFLAASGKYSEAYDILMGDKWPDDRMPSQNDHCEPWLWQRDQFSDSWEPCGTHDHAGLDWLFAAHLVLNGGL